MAVMDTRSEGEDETRRNGTGRDGDAKGGDGETVMSTSMVTLVARGGEARTRERGTRAGRRMMMPMPMAMPMARFGVQSSSDAHALVTEVEAAIQRAAGAEADGGGQGSAWFVDSPPPPGHESEQPSERWALPSRR